MFGRDGIKEFPPAPTTLPSAAPDELLSIREVCIASFHRKDFRNPTLLSPAGRGATETSTRDAMDVRPLYRSDGFFPEEQPSQASFAWTEEDGNIAAFISDSGFGISDPLAYGKDLDEGLKGELKQEPDTSSGKFELVEMKSHSSFDPQPVSSTSTTMPSQQRLSQATHGTACKVDKSDPRSRFHFVKYIKRHGRTIKLWECGICSREFQHQYTLMRHLPTHTDERNFHCGACGKSFRQLSTLSQHRAIHSSDRPYACEVCSKTFNRISTLISHRKTHSDDKPYKCHVCPKGFHQKGNLRNHLFTHTNERPYRCNVCNKGFNQQSNLVCHKNKTHAMDSGEVQSHSSGAATKLQSVLKPQTSAPRLECLNPDLILPDSTRLSTEQCEVSSSVSSVPSWTPVNSASNSWKMPRSQEVPVWLNLDESPWSLLDPALLAGGGVIVDPINTYHMGVAMATRQTPFALLKPDHGAPVLVKVIDTKLPGGKQMLVPATAEDLRMGGKIVVNKDNEASQVPMGATPGYCHSFGASFSDGTMSSAALQIRVPVVATVVPRLIPGGRLHITVEEPHSATTALSTDPSIIGEVKVEPCGVVRGAGSASGSAAGACCMARDRDGRSFTQRVEDPVLCHLQNKPDGSSFKNVGCISVMPPPAPSPPLDLISSCHGLDLFDHMECIPMGPQITAVDNVGPGPPSDDSDIFISEFENNTAFSIQLSDSD